LKLLCNVAFLRKKFREQSIKRGSAKNSNGTQNWALARPIFSGKGNMTGGKRTLKVGEGYG
tara:strand:+ start:526 stop:708 length:183 start_codon:yes stop_codon:yes gene_type:complete